VDERRCTNADIICNFFSVSAAAVSTVRGGEIIRVKMSRQVPCRFPNRKFRVNPTANDDDDDASRPLLFPLPTQNSRKMMRNSALRSVRALRTTAPRRLASSSSSPATNDAAAAAQKKAQDAFSAASATAQRAGTFARNALGPLGARLSGLLGCTLPTLLLL
jgi:hypothetical protein